MTIEEIDAAMSELRALRRQLEAEEREQFKRDAKQHVGRCFKVNGVYTKVIDIPHEAYTKTGVVFEKYRFPAITIDNTYNSIVPFRDDTLFSAAWGAGYDLLHTTYEEVTNEEFQRAFDDALDKFRYRIGV